MNGHSLTEMQLDLDMPTKLVYVNHYNTLVVHNFIH